MQFQNSFRVALPPGQAWDVLMDIPEVVPCMPGAELIEMIDEDNFKGKVSVRMGPVLLNFVGTAQFVERDPVTRTAQINAAGKDSKGRGGAKSTVDFRILPVGTDGSQVEIDTQLSISGVVAQYGRGAGVMEAIANQLIGEFSANLEEQISSRRKADAAMPSAPQSNAPASIAPTPASAEPSRKSKPISGFRLTFLTIRAMLTGLFRRG